MLVINKKNQAAEVTDAQGVILVEHDSNWRQATDAEVAEYLGKLPYDKSSTAAKQAWAKEVGLDDALEALDKTVNYSDSHAQPGQIRQTTEQEEADKHPVSALGGAASPEEGDLEVDSSDSVSEPDQPGDISEESKVTKKSEAKDKK